MTRGFSVVGLCGLLVVTAFIMAADCKYICAKEQKAEMVDINPAAAIVVPASADPNTLLAAKELAKHLALLTGVKLDQVEETGRPADKYAFYVGFAPSSTEPLLAPEEARWKITSRSAWFYGEALFAVYGFLEDALGVRWIEPGDQGIAYEPQQFPLRVTAGQFRWAPELKLRLIRNEDGGHDTQEWQMRMRMGGTHAALGYGHSFTDWWDRYGKEHPDYFALNKYGKREPESQKANPDNPTEPVGLGDKQTVKLCTSNPRVADQIVQNWLAGGKRSKWAGVCENDMSWGFCRCPACEALDVEKDMETFGDYQTYGKPLTDRYVFLANAVARAARQHDPEGGAVMYAYNETELPPRRQRLEPNVLVGVVPTTINLSKLERLFAGWQAAGAKSLFLRPNYGYYYFTTVIPMGFEKQMFDVFQLSVKHGVIAADYGSLMGHWPVTGMADYILAKAFSDPSRPFEYWEAHYCSAYGPAAGAVQRYFRYWRQELWEKRFLPELDAIAERGKYYNFVRGVMWSLGKYYTAEDFDRTDAILQEAAAKKLSPSQRVRVAQLILANRHARLVFQAVIADGTAKFEPARALLEFRRRHRDDLRLPWPSIFDRETYWGDITGIKTATDLQEYPLPWLLTDLAWRFQLDPQDVGLTEKWPEKSWVQLKDWDQIRTDHFWENQPEKMSYPSPALRAQLRNYDGIGWYATQLTIPTEMKGRAIFLYFGAVDESCWVYVNGKLAGQHLFEKPNDWNTPFEIRIDPFLVWEQSRQQVTVRVADNAGAGGIWKRVWLVSKHQPPGPAPNQLLLNLP
ncbi:MAG: DUF4838 domain-containing protein [Candidatus Omnitrophota bacterium]